MARKSVIEEPEYHGRGDKSTIIYYNLIIPVSFTQSCRRIQGSPIRKDSAIKDTSIWQQRFLRVLVQEFSAVSDVTHSKTSYN